MADPKDTVTPEDERRGEQRRDEDDPDHFLIDREQERYERGLSSNW